MFLLSWVLLMYDDVKMYLMKAGFLTTFVFYEQQKDT